MIKKEFILFLLILCFELDVNSQGCSDPGLCTIGHLNSENTKDTLSGVDYKTSNIDELLSVKVVDEKFRLDLSSLYNQGEESTTILQFMVALHMRINDKKSFVFRVPYSYISGSLGSISNVGDITVGFQNIFSSNKNYQLAYVLGGIIPSNDANLKIDNNPLPMTYQTSLGLYNVFGGVSLVYKEWKFASGYQYSIGTNKNTFTTDNLVLIPSIPNYNPLNIDRVAYPSSKKLKRGSDLFFRIERRILIKKISVFAGVLPIFRLSQSEISNSVGNRFKVKGSDGLTLNLNLAASYNVGKKWILRANYGFPIQQREVRPDGLTRHFVGIFSIIYRSW